MSDLFAALQRRRGGAAFLYVLCVCTARGKEVRILDIRYVKGVGEKRAALLQ